MHTMSLRLRVRVGRATRVLERAGDRPRIVPDAVRAVQAVVEHEAAGDPTITRDTEVQPA